MKLGIVGSRTFLDYQFLETTIDEILINYNNSITHIVSGGAKGADTLANRYAEEKDIETIIYKPDWKKYGKRAGFIRNTDIIENSDVIVAFWDGTSRGTKDSIDKAKALNKHLITIIYKQETCI